MKFSTRTLYGLRAVFVLASRFGEGSLSVSQIARREGISAAYLEQILNTLKKTGMVKSVRGPQGGYALSKKPSEITLKDLFDSFGGAWPRGAVPSKSEPDEVKIANFIFWKKLRSSVDEGLSAMTLKDLVDQARKSKKSKFSAAPVSFHI